MADTEAPKILGGGASRQRGALALGMLEHAVGDTGYRNYYATEPDDTDWELLCSLRLAVRGRVIPSGLMYYHVSVPGVAMLRSLYPRRYSRELKGVAIPDPITEAESEGTK
jgi:hypothetical protein